MRRRQPAGASPPRSTRGGAGRRLVLAGVLLGLAGLGVWAARAPAASRGARPAGGAPLAVITSSGVVRLPPPGGRCGPARRVEGVPVGWDASRVGAVSAAAGYAKTMSTLWFLADRDRRHRAIGLMATRDRAATLTAGQDRLAAGLLGGSLGSALRDGGARGLLTTALLGYRVDAFSARSARVALWAVVIYGAETGLLPGAAWTTTTIQLQWAEGDWKLAGAVTAPGPDPQPDGGAAGSLAALVAVARTFWGFTDVPA